MFADFETNEQTKMSTTPLQIAVTAAQKQLDSLYELELPLLTEGASEEVRCLRTKIYHFFVALKHRLDLFNEGFGKYRNDSADSDDEVPADSGDMMTKAERLLLVTKDIRKEIDLSFKAFDYATLCPDLASFMMNLSVELSLSRRQLKAATKPQKKPTVSVKR